MPKPKRILVIDDERTLNLDGQVNHAISSAMGLAMLRMLEDMGLTLDELWLDHDLGWDDTIAPVLNFLEARAFLNEHYPVGQIMVHSVNAPAANRMMAALRAYNVRRVDINELAGLCGAVLLDEDAS